MAVEKPKRRRGKKDSSIQNITKIEKNSSNDVSHYKAHKTPLINPSEESSSLWYDWGNTLPGRNDSIYNMKVPSNKRQSPELYRKYRSLADEIYRVENSLTVAPGGKAGADERWVENTMKKGTLKDRIAATSVLISTDPIHKLSALDRLLTMAGCLDSGQANSRVAQMAAEALEDLFLNTLLPPGRTLLRLDERPLHLYEPSSGKSLSPRILLLWRYEENLKEKYAAFINDYLAMTLKEGMDLNKIFALRTSGSMLRSTSEGEVQLLSLMVNKLGDPSRKVAAASGHELRRVLEEHEAMQEVAAREVQQLAHRPQLSPRALYNCIVFLNQLRLQNRIDISPASNLTKSEEASPSLAVSLVNTYFRMFDVAIKKQQQSDGKCMTSRLLSALLTGINRARPFLPDKDQGLERHMDALYNVSHVAAPSASTQALMLLFHVAVGTVGGTKQSKENSIKQDRFYRALYSKLSHASFLGAGKHLTMFFNLLYKAMKYDENSSRVLAFTKRLLCTVIHLNASIVNASLFLLNEVMKTHKNIEACFKNIPGNEENGLILDFTKREPLAAIVHTDGKTLEQGEIMPPLWEMCLISHHFHPSVDKFASSLGSIQYTGDPLRDFAVSPFLDKFAYKNPKTISEGNKTFAKRRFESKVTSKPVNDPAFLKKRNVDVADNFFQMFFLERSRRDEIKGISRKRDRDEDDDSISDASFDVLDEKKIEHLFDGNEDGTDSEEERFVDQIAMKLMNESRNDDTSDLDDEDPDMEGWDDLKEMKNMDTNGLTSLEEAMVNDAEEVESFEDDQSVSISDDENDGANDNDAFMDESDSDDDDDVKDLDDIDDSNKIFPATKRFSKTTKSKLQTEPVFADADEYEELIIRSYQEKQVQKSNSSNTPHFSKRMKSGKKKAKK